MRSKALRASLSARRFAEAARAAQFVEQRSVIRGIDGDRHMGVVLGRGADHRRATDVDLLDRLRECDVGIRDGGLEWVEVDDDQVDRPNLLLLEVSLIALVISTGEDPAVDPRVKRFDSPAEHLGTVREFRNVDDREARVSQCTRGATGGDQFDTEFRESSPQFDQAGLVGDGQKRALNGTRRRGGHSGISPFQNLAVDSAWRLPEVDGSWDPVNPSGDQFSNCR